MNIIIKIGIIITGIIWILERRPLYGIIKLVNNLILLSVYIYININEYIFSVFIIIYLSALIILFGITLSIISPKISIENEIGKIGKIPYKKWLIIIIIISVQWAYLLASQRLNISESIEKWSFITISESVEKLVGNIHSNNIINKLNIMSFMNISNNMLLTLIIIWLLLIILIGIFTII